MKFFAAVAVSLCGSAAVVDARMSRASVASYITDAVSELQQHDHHHLRSLSGAGAGATPQLASHYAGTVQELASQSATFKMSSYEVYDEDTGFRVIKNHEALPFNNYSYSLNMSEILTTNQSYLVLGDRCQPLPPQDRFSPMWSWLAVATFEGNKTIQGRECGLYTLDIPSKNTSLGLCIDTVSQRLPVAVNISIPGYTSREVYGPDIHEELLPTDRELMNVPEGCLLPPTICAGGQVENFDAYIFHPENQFDLYNEDVADLLGDTAFICSDALSNHTAADAYQWVSRYTLQVWSGWGDYAECNRPLPHEPGECISFETYAVGREASFSLKPHGGQCVDNSDLGVWLSLPKAGQCQNATQELGPAGDGHCSWRVVEKLKTINGSCLLNDRGMLASCRSEGDFPFPKTTAILATAFNTTDPAQGGCPDISPSLLL